MMSFGSAPLKFHHFNDFYQVISYLSVLDIFRDLGTVCAFEDQDHDQMLTYHFCYSETYSYYSYRSFHKDAINLLALLPESKTLPYFHHFYFLGSQFFPARMSLSFPGSNAPSNLRIQESTTSIVCLTFSICRDPCNLRFFSSNNVTHQSLFVYLVQIQNPTGRSDLFAG